MKRSGISLLLSFYLLGNPVFAADGDLDTSFNGTGRQTVAFDGPAFAIAGALGSDAAIYAIGTTAIGPDAPLRMAVAKLLRNGAPDPSFDADGDADGRVVYTTFAGEAMFNAGAVQPDGRLVVAGFADIDPSPAFDYAITLCRIDTDGALDESFGNIETPGCRAIDTGLQATGLSMANAVLIQPDGKIVVAGTAMSNGVGRVVIARFLPDGLPDSSGFGTAGVTILSPESDSIRLSALDLDSSGQIIVGGTLQLGTDDSDFAVFRLGTDGIQDMTFNEGMLSIAFDVGAPDARLDTLTAIQVVANDSIVVAGSAEHFPDMRQMALAVVNADGLPVQAFNGTGKMSPVFCDSCEDAVAADLYSAADGSIVVAGTVLANGSQNMGVLRVLPTGEIDFGFGAQGRSYVDFGTDLVASDDSANALLIQGGRIVVVGSAKSLADKASVMAVARLATDSIFADDFELVIQP